MKKIKSISAFNTVTEKKLNEDSITSFENKNLNIKGIIVGDGIGSHYNPHLGSAYCVDKLSKILSSCKSINEFDLHKYFLQVLESLKNKYHINNDSINDYEAYGTTLICAIEFKEEFKIAYIGNGSIWHLRGNFDKLINSSRYLPWSALNILNPHTVEKDGKESLYKFFSLGSTEKQINPSIITITKDNNYFGDILIVSTDGLYSCDHNPIAKDKSGGLWISGEKKMEILFNHLMDYFSTEISQISFEKSIKDYCESIKEKKLLDDDTSIGLIVTKKTIEHQTSDEDN